MYLVVSRKRGCRLGFGSFSGGWRGYVRRGGVVVSVIHIHISFKYVKQFVVHFNVKKCGKCLFNIYSSSTAYSLNRVAGG